jgi:hypothetical protein
MYVATRTDFVFFMLVSSSCMNSRRRKLRGVKDSGGVGKAMTSAE